MRGDAMKGTMMNNRKGDWMQTVTGGQFWPLDPRTDDVKIVDIAHALSMQCRYSGHCLQFYSVAQHCCHVSDACPPEHALWGLLHDASEAYLADVIRPIKPDLTNYKAIEKQLMLVICERFGLSVDEPAIVSELDRRILGNECASVMAPPPVPWYHTGEPISDLHIPMWAPELARYEFMWRFNRLTQLEAPHAP
jgi:hypothetical protein